MSEKQHRRKRSEEVAIGRRTIRWLSARKVAIQFTLIFLFALGILTGVLENKSVQESFVNPHLTNVAIISSKILNVLGTKCRVLDTTIRSSSFNMRVVEGCESIYPTAMLWAAVLAFPTGWKAKVSGIVGGAVVLFFLNLLRIITMFYFGLLFPSLFEAIHVYAWQALFILVTLLLYLFWAARVSEPGKSIGV